MHFLVCFIPKTGLSLGSLIHNHDQNCIIHVILLCYCIIVVYGCCPRDTASQTFSIKLHFSSCAENAENVWYYRCNHCKLSIIGCNRATDSVTIKPFFFNIILSGSKLVSLRPPALYALYVVMTRLFSPAINPTIGLIFKLQMIT